jgi:hypothetical protein
MTKHILYLITLIIIITALVLLVINIKKCNILENYKCSVAGNKIKVIKINNWYGRLGNNIKQVINCCHMALHLNCNIIIPKHEFFNKTNIVINRQNHINTGLEIEYIEPSSIDQFFSRDEILKQLKNLLDIDKSIFDNNKQAICSIIKDLFVIKCKKNDQPNDLYIHIRSGDIFVNPHPLYIQPPLTFYTNIINSTNYNKIYLIAEDTVNPVVNRLLEIYSNTIWKKQDLNKDIENIINCKNIIFGIGSFVPNILYMNDNLKKIWTCDKHDFVSGYNANNILINVIDLTKYYNEMGNAVGLQGDNVEGIWKNTPLQLKIMIDFKF